MELKYVRYALIGLVVVFPIFFLPFLSFAAVTSHTFLAFLVIELSLFAWLWNASQNGSIALPRSRVLGLWWLYIIVLFITALVGADFNMSFWSSTSRMSGLVTWLHYGVFASLAAALFRPRDWQWVFRGLVISLGLLALGSWLGPDGFGWEVKAWRQGGSWLGNTSFSGAYYVLGLLISVIGYSQEADSRWRKLYSGLWVLVLLSPDLLSFDIWQAVLRTRDFFPVSWLGEARLSSVIAWASVPVFGGIMIMHHRVASLRVRTTVWLTSIAVMLIAIVGTFVLALHPGSVVQDTYVDLTGPSRLTTWQRASDAIQEKPFGYGVENFRVIYQENLDATVVQYEDTPWFSRAHNFFFDTLSDAGILGLLAKLGFFVALVMVSMRGYQRDEKIWWLFIPVIAVMHFAQLQTFFETDSTIFLLSLLVGFTAAQSQRQVVYLARHKQVIAGLLAVVILVVGMVYCVMIPLDQNRTVVRIYTTQDFAARITYYDNLKTLRMDPFETIRTMGMNFTHSFAANLDQVYRTGQVSDIAEELAAISDLFALYLPRYSEQYRYLVNYANLENMFTLVQVDRLAEAEALARKAITLEDNYPQAHWVLAMSLFYQGRYEEATQSAQYALVLNPDIETSQELIDFINEQRDAEPVAGIQGIFIIPKL